jgi:hypothetical protein
MCLWATCYLESWKRTEKLTACKWGMVDFEQEQMSRPEFEALAFERESAVTGDVARARERERERGREEKMLLRPSFKLCSRKRKSLIDLEWRKAPFVLGLC